MFSDLGICILGHIWKPLQDSPQIKMTLKMPETKHKKCKSNTKYHGVTFGSQSLSFWMLITFGLKHFVNIFGVAKGKTSHLPLSQTEDIRDESIWLPQALSVVPTVFKSLSFNFKVTIIQINFSLSLQFRWPHHEAWLATRSLNQGFSYRFWRQIECLLRSCCFVKALLEHCFAFLCNYTGGPQSGSKRLHFYLYLVFPWVLLQDFVSFRCSWHCAHMHW